jgi:hypothetical protein
MNSMRAHMESLMMSKKRRMVLQMRMKDKMKTKTKKRKSRSCQSQSHQKYLKMAPISQL